MPTEVDDAATLFLDEYAAGRCPSVEAFLSRLATEEERERFKKILRFAMTVENFPPTSLLPGQPIGPFVIEEKIHEGPMGSVYRARDTRFVKRRQVAIKVLPGSRPANDPLIKRLTAEAEVLASLDHPHIVTVFESGQVGEVRYFVMEWIDGISLEDAVKGLVEKRAARNGRLTLDDLLGVVNRPPKEGDELLFQETDDYWMAIARIMRKICMALEAVHEKEILHRDLKPGNVMLTAGCVPKVVDFGLAGSKSHETGTVTRQLVGSPPYLAPEQVRAKQVGRDPRSEVYQLGLILYELLTLKRAFPHDSLTQLVQDIAFGQFRPPRRVDRNVPRDLETICMVATEPDRDRRYQTANEMRLELQRFLERKPLMIRRPGPLRRMGLFARRNRKPLAAAGIALLMGGLGGWWYWDSSVVEAAQCMALVASRDGSAESTPRLAERVRPGDDIFADIDLPRESTILALSFYGPDQARLDRLWVKVLKPVTIDEMKAGHWPDKRIALNMQSGAHRLWLTRVKQPGDAAAEHPWIEGLMVFALRKGRHPRIEQWFTELAETDVRVLADAALRQLAAMTRGGYDLTKEDRSRLEEVARQGTFDRKRPVWPLAQPRPFEFYFPLETTTRTGDAAAPASKVPKRALLVGITRYRHPGANDDLHDLEGCLNDVERVRAILTKRFGFADRDVVVLRNEEATHQRVVEEFHRHLIQPATAGMEVVFYWAGHGSQTPDASGRAGVEADRKDSTLVAYDSRRKGRAEPFDITDDEIHSLLWSLCAKQPRITVITDCCHSAGVTRGPASPPTRSAPPGLKPVAAGALAPFWPADVPLLDDDHGKRDERQQWIHVAACRAQDPAYEYVVAGGGKDERHFGALSFFLVEELERLAPRTTFAQLGQRVAARVATHHPFQQVIVTGDQDRVVFDGQFGPPLPGFAGTIERGESAVRVRAGRLHGLRHGSVLEVMDVNLKTLGHARVSMLESVTSQAQWIKEGIERPAEAVAVRLQEIERGEDPLMVFVPPGGTEDTLAASLALKGKGLLHVVRDAGMAPRYQVFEPRPGSGFELWAIPGDLVLWREKEDKEKVDVVGVSLEDRVDRTAGALVDMLASEARYHALMRLGDERGTIPMTVRVEPAGDETIETLRDRGVSSPAPVEFRPASADGDAPSDSSARLTMDFSETSDIVEIKVSIPREAAAKPYIAVLSVTEYRSAHLLWPLEHDQTNALSPGESLSVPAHVIVRENKWKLERPMRDRYLIIATERPADFSSYQSEGTLVEQARTFEGRGMRGDGGAPLPQILQQALGGATRGEGLGKTAPQKFGVTCVDLLVQRAGK